MDYDETKMNQEQTEEGCDDEALAEEVEKFDVKQVSIPIGDPLKMYLAEIATFPRLTKEQELELGKLKDEGDEEAREDLINCNMRLVVALAKKKYDAVNCLGSIQTTLEDMIQDGTIGLITAVDKYDWTKGFKFSTSAVYWINHAILEGLTNNARTIRLPDHKVEEMVVVRKAANELYQALSREPSASELSSYLNMKFSEAEVNNLLKLIHGSTVVSLSAPMGEDADDGEIGDMIADTADTPKEYSARISLREDITEALDGLDARERIVIEHAFGVGCEKSTLDEIADLLYQEGFTNRDGQKISKEGIRQLRDRTLEKMKKKIDC